MSKPEGGSGNRPVSMSLDEFAAKNPTGARSWFTLIPEFDECLDAWKRGVAAGVIRNWLTEERGYSPEVATESRVCAYLRRMYPRRDGAA